MLTKKTLVSALKLVQCGCASVLILSSLFLAGCGGGGGGGGTTTPVVTTVTSIKGVAANGAPSILINATITLTDSTLPTAKTVTTTTDAKSSFSFDVTGLKAPFVLKAVLGNITLFSVQDIAPTAGSTIIVNITPITTAITGVMSTTGKPADITTTTVTTTKLVYVKTFIQKSLAPSLTAANVPLTFDPINDSFVADGTGFDSIIDNVQVAISPTNKIWLVDKNIKSYCTPHTLGTHACWGVSDPGNTTSTNANICGFVITTGAAVPCDQSQPTNQNLYDPNALVTTGTPTFVCYGCIFMSNDDFSSGVPSITRTLSLTQIGTTIIIPPPPTTPPTTSAGSILAGSAAGYTCYLFQGAIDRCSYINSCAANSGNGSGYYQTNLGTYPFSSLTLVAAAASAAVNACVP